MYSNRWTADQLGTRNVFKDLERALHACFNNQAALPQQVMNEVAQGLFSITPIDLKEVVHTILQNETLLTRIAHGSYLQGNGFYKIVLLDTEQFRLRLHVYRPGVAAQENLHSHRWYFASSVMKGELHSEVWEDTFHAEDPAFPEYLYLGKDQKVSPIGEAKVRHVSTTVHKAGEVYVLAPDVLHRVVRKYQDMTITLMCRPTCGRVWSRNIDVNGVVPEVAPTFMDKGELTEVFNQVLTYLS